jgi:cell pole-organizing protein PopZ
MLRPILREWVDANLPNMVEDMVSREIAKIMNQQP